MRLARILALSIAVLTLPAPVSTPAGAADLRVHPGSMRALPAPPPARTPSVLKGPDPGLEHFDGRGRDHGRHGHQRQGLVVPQTVFVNPGRCWQPGYWTYQFVPQSYTYSTWVAGQWSPDGRWIDGHYAPGVYNSGYYQPLWVEGYYSGC